MLRAECANAVAGHWRELRLGFAWIRRTGQFAGAALLTLHRDSPSSERQIDSSVWRAKAARCEPRNTLSSAAASEPKLTAAQAVTGRQKPVGRTGTGPGWTAERVGRETIDDLISSMATSLGIYTQFLAGTQIAKAAIPVQN
jgi:hypothetical protein